MISQQHLQNQLKKVGAKIGMLGHKEIKELSKILIPGEEIRQCLVGLYNDAVSLLCVTNLRVLVVDKRPLFINIEDVRYDMINEVDFGGRLLNSFLTMHSFGKVFRFKSWQNDRLRSAYALVQEMIMQTKQSALQMPVGVNEIKSPIMWRRSVSKFSRPTA